LYRDVLGYKDNRLNVLCMLPRHWKTSDLQPLLLGIHTLRRDLGEKGLPFRLFVMDPYSSTTERAMTMAIKGLGLENDVLNLMSESYPADLLPVLRDADALVDLADWNTLPYPLRMATALGIPVMVSASTHFAGLVEQYQTGVVVNQPDAPNSVAFALRQLATPDFWPTWSVNAREKLSQKLSWISIAERLIRQAEALAPENPTSLTG
jgi:glycosyltransferase involved in cell wall biosynthesis